MDPEIGAWRYTDPPTSEDAARSIDASTIKYAIMVVLRDRNTPLNGWEISRILGMQTISVVPRFKSMRDDGWIVQLGTRPGPGLHPRQQIAYVLTAFGHKLVGPGR